MSQQNHDEYWSQDEVAKRLEAVREELLGFLRERTRLEWFEQKVRWRLSRRYIWPGGADSSALDQAVEGDVGVEAFREHLARRKRTISEAIERYNHAVRRHLEVVLGRPVNQFGAAERDRLCQQRITFQGIHDELRRRGRDLTASSGPELIPELLSLRLAILNADARREVFSAVAATLADERADQQGDMGPEERELIAFEIELRLRCLDRYHVTRLLAVNYPEGRRFMKVDRLLERYQELIRQRASLTEPDPWVEARLVVVREVAERSLGFLEQIFPKTEGTHERERAVLRGAPA